MLQPSKISQDDCQDIIEAYFKNNQFKVVSFNIKPIANSVGYLCTHEFLKITVQAENIQKQLSFFLKSFKDENETATAFVKLGNLFNKEIECYKFFEKLRSDYPCIDLTFAPKYYLSRNNEFIVLENISESGYKIWDLHRMDSDHLKVILNAIAKFHASGLIFEEIQSKNLGREYSLVEDLSEYLEEPLFREDENFFGYKYIQNGVRALHALIDQIPSRLSNFDFKEKVTQITSRAFHEMRTSTARKALSHGDLWIKNVMFKYEGSVPVKCKIFDFQFLRYAPPAQDVLHMLYDSPEETFQNNLEMLLKYYFETLKNEFECQGLDVESRLTYNEFCVNASQDSLTMKLLKAIHKSVAGILFNGKEVDICFNVIQAFKTQEAYRTLMISFLSQLENALINIDENENKRKIFGAGLGENIKS